MISVPTESGIEFVALDHLIRVTKTPGASETSKRRASEEIARRSSEEGKKNDC